MIDTLILIYEEIIRPLFYIFGIFYTIPYLIRTAWGNADHRTKRVCDTCFRDIKKWNEFVKKRDNK